MRADALNSHVYPIRTGENGTQQISTSQGYSKDESELKEFLVDENLSHICSTDEDESKSIIVENVPRRKMNQNAFTKILTNKNTHRTRQIMSNLQLQMKCRSILTYLNAVRIF